jgi:hypothetical protein
MYAGEACVDEQAVTTQGTAGGKPIIGSGRGGHLQGYDMMAAANGSGGVMGKMIDAQSIVVASTATQWYGHEGDILRYVFFHSIALAALVGIMVTLQAYVVPFTHLVIH